MAMAMIDSSHQKFVRDDTENNVMDGRTSMECNEHLTMAERERGDTS